MVSPDGNVLPRRVNHSDFSQVVLGLPSLYAEPPLPRTAEIPVVADAVALLTGRPSCY